VITPHAGELAAMLEGEAKPGSASQIAANPGEWAIRAARLFDVTVLLKGAVTHVASPSGARLTVSSGPAWLATAGSGDVLGGILGALLATHVDRLEADASSLAPLAATAALLHAVAANLASAGGPIAALDVADAVPRAVAALLDHGVDARPHPTR
jgi:NAD(P)H-hydrate repair Nnr-like enzyme with NAD(P)H-hydrate dehydratase domain